MLALQHMFVTNLVSHELGAVGTHSLVIVLGVMLVTLFCVFTVSQFSQSLGTCI
jgi:hypothetical protein